MLVASSVTGNKLGVKTMAKLLEKFVKIIEFRVEDCDLTKKICTFGVTVDSKAALRCLEFGDKSGSSTETFLFTGNRGDWKIGV